MPRASTEPLFEIESAEPSVIVDLDQIDEAPARPRRLRTAVGTTPPTLRPPDLADGVPREIVEDGDGSALHLPLEIRE